ncbi:glycosyltransferase family 1 protein [Haliea sp. E1-2-M8]|uniref:glycosyltransferase family 4 protein n=1 Tax=Haliea sp. E1-2-M8 TaxID=3064706 RepID=UPI00271E3F37|nr:glycosyltransferase family 1 protein [Haliea sp. E1-2-M8]MDO8861100.1 glycosyltransferase family 1 protein [Haliea sp. E1-2-M8]
MKIILGGEPLLGNLTGIGQYTRHVLEGLRQAPAIDQVSVYLHGRLISASQALEMANGQSDPQADRPNFPLLARMHGRASRSDLLVRAYRTIAPAMYAWGLRGSKRTDLFHSPNFLLPSAFPGRVIVTVHDLSTWLHPEWHPAGRSALVNHHLRRLACDTCAILTISDLVKRQLVEHLHIPAERVRVTPLGAASEFAPIDARRFDTACPFPKLEYKRYFLALATLEPRKNLQRLLDAWIEYRRARGSQALPLVLAGEAGWQCEDLLHRIARIPDNGNLIRLGYVDQENVPTLVAGARALLFPSLYEGFGLPVLEALQSGTAVLTSRGTPMEELVGEAAWLVDPTDTSSITHAIESLHDEEATMSKRVEMGLQRAGHYSWQNCVASTIEAYQELLNR